MGGTDGEYVDGEAHANGIESFWSMLRRGYAGKFAGRHNLRNLDTIEQMQRIAQGMAGKRLRYADSIA